jgi:hypothetical protein
MPEHGKTIKPIGVANIWSLRLNGARLACRAL